MFSLIYVLVISDMENHGLDLSEAFIVKLKIILFTYGFEYTERKKKRRVNFIPKFHSSLKKLLNILL